MIRILSTTTIALACGLTALGIGQQGELQGLYQRASLQSIESRIGLYLNGEEIPSILTPGEFCEWKLPLKAGQVVIAEARSDAFDPALEMLDGKSKLLAGNDDRYPGDQRPLLLWRCVEDGTYLLHVRSFKDKAGGQVFVRFKTFDSVDLSSGKMVEQELDARASFLLRVPMKAGEVKDIVPDFGGGHTYMPFVFNTVIFPNGLPERDPSLSQPLAPAIYALIAPADGDYYLMETPSWNRDGRGRVRVGARAIVPAKLTLAREPRPENLGLDGGQSHPRTPNAESKIPPKGNERSESGRRTPNAVSSSPVATASAPNNVPALWELPVKAGELLEVSVPDLDPNCSFTLSEKPDFSKYDVSKPETNPFYPLPSHLPPAPEQAFDPLPKRARDNRLIVFRARRDAKLWLATNGVGPADRQFALHVRPAAAEFAEEKMNSSKLRIADTDYWAFDANAGDVMTLNAATAGFAQMIIVRDPDLNEIRHAEAALDQTADNWRMIAQKPGRYLVAVSCLGNGGGGEYSLARKSIHPQNFSIAEPAKGEIAGDQVQVWKFTATPTDPLFVRWSSTNWSYDVAIYDDKGRRTDFQRQDIDDHERLGILKVSKPQTYVIVLTGKGDKASYKIDLERIKK